MCIRDSINAEYMGDDGNQQILENNHQNYFLIHQIDSLRQMNTSTTDSPSRKLRKNKSFEMDDKKPDIMDPDLINLISAVSQVLHDQILEDLEDGKTIDENDDYYVFSEDKYINERFDMDQDNENIKAAIEELKRVPTVEDIANFLASLFEMSQLKQKCVKLPVKASFLCFQEEKSA
eukprot:TRINITY_DN3253_c0_g1_i5.p1 TRINITY_DN3253_c0_g1~~TRINITY_DN3253_c0_g1_i5.p1  ORF type:complete len:205 (-),score=54.13 TRINITY_DN3253_c0_g1_i5:624-1154(-)